MFPNMFKIEMNKKIGCKKASCARFSCKIWVSRPWKHIHSTAEVPASSMHRPPPLGAWVGEYWPLATCLFKGGWPLLNLMALWWNSELKMCIDLQFLLTYLYMYICVCDLFISIYLLRFIHLCMQQFIFPVVFSFSFGLRIRSGFIEPKKHRSCSSFVM